MPLTLFPVHSLIQAKLQEEVKAATPGILARFEKLLKANIMIGKDSLLVTRYDVALFKSVGLSVTYSFIDSALLSVVNSFIQL